TTGNDPKPTTGNDPKPTTGNDPKPPTGGGRPKPPYDGPKVTGTGTVKTTGSDTSGPTILRERTGNGPAIKLNKNVATANASAVTPKILKPATAPMGGVGLRSTSMVPKASLAPMGMSRGFGGGGGPRMSFGKR